MNPVKLSSKSEQILQHRLKIAVDKNLDKGDFSQGDLIISDDHLLNLGQFRTLVQNNVLPGWKSHVPLTTFCF